MVRLIGADNKAKSDKIRFVAVAVNIFLTLLHVSFLWDVKHRYQRVNFTQCRYCILVQCSTVLLLRCINMKSIWPANTWF